MERATNLHHPDDTATPRTRLDWRTTFAQELARINMHLASIGVDARLAEFATPEQLAHFRAGIERARREVTAAELALHDLVWGVQIDGAA